MASLAELAIVLTAKDTASSVIGKVKDSASGLQKSFGTLGAAGQHAGTESASGLGKIGPAASAQRNPISVLTSALGGIGLASLGIQAVAGALGGLGKVAGFGLATEMENTRTQFLAFTKDAALTDQILADLRAEADKTPFSFLELSKATASLIPASKQANIPLKDLIKTAEILAASNPAQGLEGAAFSLREALSGDFVSIIDRFNLPRQRLNELKAQGVPALQAITTAMSEMGIDASLVAGMATTMSGRLSTLGDTVDSLKLAFVTPIFEAFKEGLVGLQSGLDLNMDGMKAFATTAGKAVGQFASSIVKGIPVAISALSKLGPVISSVGPAIAGIAGAVRSSLPTLQSLGRQFVALGKFIHLVVIDGDTMNDWLTHMSPAFRAVAYIVSTSIVQLRALGRVLIEIIRSPVVGWIRDMAGSLLSLLFSVREGSGEFRAMIAPLNLVALGLTALITAMVVGTVLSFVSAVGGLAASILTFPLRPLITASEAVAGFVKNAAGLVSKAISITANVVTAGAEALANLLTNKSIDVKPKLGDTADFDEFFSRERIIPTKIEAKEPGPASLLGVGEKIAAGIASGVGGAIGGAIAGAIAGAVAVVGIGAITAALAPLALAITVAFGALLFVSFQEEIGLAFEFLAGAIVDGIQGLNSAFDRFDAFVGERIKGAFSGAVGAAGEAFGGLPSTVISALSDVLGAVVRFSIDLAGDPIGSIIGALETVSTAFREFPRLAGQALIDGIGGINDAFDRFDAVIGERIKGLFNFEGFAVGLKRGAEIWEEFKARISGRGTPKPVGREMGEEGSGVGRAEPAFGSPRLVTQQAFEEMQGAASAFTVPTPDLSGFIAAFENAKISVMSTLEGLRVSVAEGLGGMVAGGQEILDSMVAFVAGAFAKGIGGGVNATLKHFTEFVGGIGRRANDAMGLLENWLDSARRIFATFQPLSWIASALSALISGITGALAQVVSAIVSAVQNVFTAFSGFRPWDAVSGAFSTLISNAQSRLDDFLGMIRGAASTASDLWNDLTKPRAAAVPLPVFVPTPASPAYEYPPDTGQGDSYQTGPGQYKVVPGAPNQPKTIMAHGGEIIGRPFKNMLGGLKSYQTEEGEFREVDGPLGELIPIIAHGGEAILPMDELRERFSTIGFGDKQVISPFDRAQQTIFEVVNSIVQASHTLGAGLEEQSGQFLGRMRQTKFGEFVDSVVGIVRSNNSEDDQSKGLRYWDETFSEFMHRHRLGHIVGADNRIFEDEFYRDLNNLIAESAGKIIPYQHLDPIAGQHEVVSRELANKLFSSGSLLPAEVAARIFGLIGRPGIPTEGAGEVTDSLGIREVFQNTLGEYWTRLAGSMEQPPPEFAFSYAEHFGIGIREAFQNALGEYWTRPAGNSEEPPIGFELAYSETFATAIREVFKNALGEFWTRPIGSEEAPPEGFEFAYPESFQTKPGETKVVPGTTNQPRLIMAHGGEVIGRPFKNAMRGLKSYQTEEGEFKEIDGPLGASIPILAHGGEAIMPMSELRERVATVGFGDKQVVSPFDRAQQTIYEIVNAIVQASHALGSALEEQAGQFLGHLRQTRFGGFIDSVVGIVKSKDLLANEPIFDPSKAIRSWDETFSEFMYRHDLGHLVGPDDRIFEDEFYRSMNDLISQSSGRVTSYQSLDPITGQHESVSRELAAKLSASGSLFPTEVAARILGATTRSESKGEETSKLGIREVFQNPLGELWTRFGGSVEQPPPGFEFSYPEHFGVGIREAFQNVFGDFWTRPLGNSEQPPPGFELAYPETFATAVREVFKNALEEFWTRPAGSEQEPPAGFHFAYPESFQTAPGQMKMVPGGINQPRLIMAHGGEAVMRPINASSGFSSTSTSVASGPISVAVNMGGVTVTNEADEQRLAQTIVQGLEESLDRQFGMSTSFPHGLRGKA